MISDIRASWALFIGVGFMMLGNGLQGTLLGLRATMEGFPTFTTGIMMSGYFIGVFLGSLLAPRLVSRVGHIRVFAALASLASVAILVHGLHVHPATWMFMRIVTGMSYAGLYIVSESWLNDRSSNETRGKMLSFYMVVTTMGLGGGQFLLNLASPMDIDLFVLISVIVSLGLIPILLTARPAPSFEFTGKMSLKALYKASPLAMTANCLTGMAHGTIFGLGAVYARQVLFDFELISWFMACFLIGSVIMQWPIGWISDRIDRRLVMACVAAAATVACLVAILLPKGGVLFFITVGLVGGFAMPMYSLCIAYANDRLEPDQIVAASGGLMMAAGLGLSIGPIITSFFMGKFGPSIYFISIGAFFGLVVCYTLYRMMRRAGVDIEDQLPHVNTGHIGMPIAEYMAPDADEYVEAVVCGEGEIPEELSLDVERRL